MALSTKSVNTASDTSKRDKILKLMAFHRPLFEREGVINPKFIPRLCYQHKGEKVIGFYQKEIYGGKDIYVEFCDRDYNPEDDNRTLWKWIFNPEFATEYELSDSHPATGDKRFLIPVAELINVVELHVQAVIATATEETKMTFLDEKESAGNDVPYDAMTLRDYCAITWQRPVSHKQWLNELINNTFK